jgi:hypothetical protein
MQIPNDYKALQDFWALQKNQLKDLYLQSQHSFIPGLLPETAIQLSVDEIIELLEKKLGRGTLEDALNPNITIPSPIAGESNSNWMKRTNMVGINVRTIHNFFNIIKYSLTLPDYQQSIHILPIWEVGVVASLYGMASWNINPEFFSQELYEEYPHLDTVEKQLKAVVNLLHASGRVVGMDVIPHTDRYSEIVLANPQYFEWLRRRELEILDHKANLHDDVQNSIMLFLVRNGSAVHAPYPDDTKAFFEGGFSEEDRLLILFGESQDYEGRMQRREKLVQHLYDQGFEPVPATMAPPYRGLEVDPSPDAKTVDDKGRIWRDYQITKPEPMSRVFGPLTRFKLYERLNDNQDWEIDFDQPRKTVWQYVCNNYAQVQTAFNFDFMRGDMSHVQMRSEGVPKEVDQYYDIHKAVVNHIQKKAPYFAYFAETFMAPAGHMAYGDEIAHLIQSDADSTLGDLQSMVVGSERFIENFAWYLQVLQAGKLAPNFTLMTGDKDDPRFDKFYVKGNEIRLFIGLFLSDMPSYMGLGFESRDTHLAPAPNEHYTKLYVFKITDGPKATKGSYTWGQNAALFTQLTQIRLLAEKIMPVIDDAQVEWLISPDNKHDHKLIAWTQQERPKYIFLANLDIDQEVNNIDMPFNGKCELIFSTHRSMEEMLSDASETKVSLVAGEGLVFKVLEE